MAFLTGQNPKLCDVGRGSVCPWASELCLWIVRIGQPELNDSTSALLCPLVSSNCTVWFSGQFQLHEKTSPLSSSC